MSDTTTAEDRCRGVLVGLAAGDRIGGPIRMALRLAESLLHCGGFDPADTLDRYLRWWRGRALANRPGSPRAGRPAGPCAGRRAFSSAAAAPGRTPWIAPGAGGGKEPSTPAG